MSLTKTQKAFYAAIVKDMIVSRLLQHVNPEYIEVVGAEARNIMAETDVEALSAEFAEIVHQQIDFKTFKKVDTYLRSDEVTNAIQASAVAFAALAEGVDPVLKALAETIDTTLAERYPAEATEGAIEA